MCPAVLKLHLVIEICFKKNLNHGIYVLGFHGMLFQQVSSLYM